MMPYLKKGIIFIYIFICPCALLAADRGIEKKYPQQLEALIIERRKAEEALPLETDTYFRYMPARHVDAMPGSVGIIETANETSYELKAFDKLPVELSFHTQYIGINNSTEVKLPSHLTGLVAGLQATVPFLNFNKTYFRLAVYPGYRTENWNARTSAFRMPVHTFLIYEPDEKWTFVAGIGTYPDYRTKVVPIVGFIYKPNDKLIFNVIPNNPNITYSFNDRLSLFLEGGIMSEEYEVDKEEFKNTVLEYKSYRSGIGANYKFNKYIKTNVSVGGVFKRQLRYRDSLGKVGIKDGLYSEFRLDFAI